jgi:hypothetical protein
MTYKNTNRLIEESSPYLLQHAHNPVDWYPWGTEAFERAKNEDKPFFLSIGYSTCHWCHVMERESFEDERIAGILNEHFVAVKVDREQRPDVDETYMLAVQAMTGSGGWPLSVFLTPDGKPFYGGTYFPPRGGYGRPGFERVLLIIADTWKNKRDELLESAAKITELLQVSAGPSGQEELSIEILDKAYSYFQRMFDSTYGGFGSAPKFPQPAVLSMLLRYWARTGQTNAREMVTKTLDAMADGGIYDHIGGGFHRYSTDQKWLVPHFEKMLYDQALLSNVYLQAFQVTRKDKYAIIARDVFDYVLRDMTDSEGGFYSAEDADSPGGEGAFYVWRKSEIDELLEPEQADILTTYYGVTDAGNFEQGCNILHADTSVGALAERFNRDGSEIEHILVQGRCALMDRRARRPRPGRDDKIIAGWNGLMISSLALGGAALREQRYVRAAERAADFVLSALRVPKGQADGRLMRYYRQGRIVDRGFLDDYSCVILGLLDLYEATFNIEWLMEARRLAEQMVELFGDDDPRPATASAFAETSKAGAQRQGAFFLTGRDAERLITRSKPGYDGAVPGGNSVAAFVLLKLGMLTAEKSYVERAEQILRAFSSSLSASPQSVAGMLSAVDLWLGPTRQIVIAGDAEQAAKGQGDAQEMLRFVQSKYLPRTVLLFRPVGEAWEQICKQLPFLGSYVARDGKATAYVCGAPVGGHVQDYVCSEPVQTIEELQRVLSRPAPARAYAETSRPDSPRRMRAQADMDAPK